MQAARPPILRGILLLAALAAIAFIMARGENQAAATSYNPHNNVSISDPTPGAAADITINFSVDAPDSFPNIKTNSTIQFIPRSWGIHTPATDGANAAPVGSIAGTFNALTTLGIFGGAPCIYQIPVPFTMIDASVDTSNVTSALDIGGDAHPGGPGYSGQFAEDPNTIEVPGDLGLPLVNFNANEKYNDQGGMNQDFGASLSTAYRDVDGSNNISPGDIRLTAYHYPNDIPPPIPAGTVVQAGDVDDGGYLTSFNQWMNVGDKHAETVAANGQMDPGEMIYKDVDSSGTVSYGDKRLLPFGQLPKRSTVANFSQMGGINRYPDFLNQIFPPAVIGDPLARQFGAKQVLTTAVSLNIVTYRPGQLPGYPATLGYPNIVVLLDPVAPIEAIQINMTSDLCTPLSLTSTNLGVSLDNPTTLANEAGYVRLTNPKSEKDHTFTLVTTSQPDADNDGQENMLDTCPLNPNVDDNGHGGDLPVDIGNMGMGADWDALDAACDPDPNNPSPGSFWAFLDEDMDNYGNRADNCATTPNGIELLDAAIQQVPGFVFFYGIPGDLIGPSNQTDTDGDDIGDACDPNPTQIDGHMHVVTLTQSVAIFKHGIKLNALGGPKTIKDNGARNYNVSVSNLSDSSSEDVQVALRVVEGCATVNGVASENTAVVSVGPGSGGSASFTVDFTGCAPGEYTVQADACHAGDAAPAGFFGSGACPGTSDGMTDPNPLDDAPIAKSVDVGTP